MGTVWCGGYFSFEKDYSKLGCFIGTVFSAMAGIIEHVAVITRFMPVIIVSIAVITRPVPVIKRYKEEI